jgi:hypothetical protein
MCSNLEPYYCSVAEYSLTNTEKAKLGEQAFTEALTDFPVFMNVTYGKRQNDIDHLIITGHSVVMNECKNVNENFFMWYSWFVSHVVDRFADGYPIAQHYASFFGYPVRNIVFTLTIPYLNADKATKLAIKGLKIHTVETKKQLLTKEHKKQWYPLIRKQILSVINTTTRIMRVYNVTVGPVHSSLKQCDLLGIMEREMGVCMYG